MFCEEHSWELIDQYSNDWVLLGCDVCGKEEHFILSKNVRIEKIKK